MTESFADATAVARREAIGDDTAPVIFDSAVKPGWDIGGNANGGYLLAIAGRAMAETVGRPPLTITAHYLKPAPAGPCEVEVDDRAGRSSDGDRDGDHADGRHRDPAAARNVRRSDARRPGVQPRGPDRSAELRGFGDAAAPHGGPAAGHLRAPARADAPERCAGSARVSRPATARWPGGSPSPTTSRSTRSRCSSSPMRSRRPCSTPSCRWRGCRRSS